MQEKTKISIGEVTLIINGDFETAKKNIKSLLKDKTIRDFLQISYESRVKSNSYVG